MAGKHGHKVKITMNCVTIIRELDAGVMEVITKGPAFGDSLKTVTRICLIVKNPRALNSRTIGVTMMKRVFFLHHLI
jgi:hypothetical protein